MSETIELDQQDELVLKARRLELLRKKVELKRNFGLLFYQPHAKQDSFHRAGDFKRRGYFAGNRSGKSQGGCAEDCSWLLGYRPFYQKDDPARTAGIPQRPVKGLVITTDWDKVDEIWTTQRGDEPGKLWQLLPKGFVKHTSRNHSGAIDTCECENGSLLRFDTYKSFMANPMGSESSNWDFIHVDEPICEPMWKAASRGLMDSDGSAWFTLTNLSEPWITDMFFPGKLRDQEKVEILDGSRKRMFAVRGSIYDNPYIPVDAIKEFEASLTDDEKQCRLFGVPLHLSGLVYKEFDSSIHVLKDVPKGWKDFLTPPDNYTLYYAIDPHPRTPHAVLFCWVSPHGQKFFCGEVFQHCVMRELAVHIKAVTRGYFVARAKCDPLAYIPDPINDSCMADELALNDIYVEKATKDLDRGILHAKQELRVPNNIYVGPHMTRFLWEISRYCWDKDKNKPVDKDDHMMENFYRLLLEDMVYIDPSNPTANTSSEVVVGHDEVYQEDERHVELK